MTNQKTDTKNLSRTAALREKMAQDLQKAQDINRVLRRKNLEQKIQISKFMGRDL